MAVTGLGLGSIVGTDCISMDSAGAVAGTMKVVFHSLSSVIFAVATMLTASNMSCDLAWFLVLTHSASVNEIAYSSPCLPSIIVGTWSASM